MADPDMRSWWQEELDILKEEDMAQQRTANLERILQKNIEDIQMETSDLQARTHHATEAEAQQKLPEAQRGWQEERSHLLQAKTDMQEKLQQAQQKLQVREQCWAEREDQRNQEISKMRGEIFNMNLVIEERKKKANLKKVEMEEILRVAIESFQKETWELRTRASQAMQAQAEGEKQLTEANQTWQEERAYLLRTQNDLQEQFKRAEQELQCKEQLWAQKEYQWTTDMFKLQEECDCVEATRKHLKDEKLVLQRKEREANQRATEVERTLQQAIESLQMTHEDLQARTSYAIKTQAEAESQLAEFKKAWQDERSRILVTQKDLQEQLQEARHGLHAMEQLWVQKDDQSTSHILKLQKHICQIETIQKHLEEENKVITKREKEAHHRQVDVERTQRNNIKSLQKETRDLHTMFSNAMKAQADVEKQLAEAHQTWQEERMCFIQTQNDLQEGLQQARQELHERENLWAQKDDQRTSDFFKLQTEICNMKANQTPLEKENMALLSRLKEAHQRSVAVERNLEQTIKLIQIKTKDLQTKTSSAMKYQAEAERQLAEAHHAWQEDRRRFLLSQKDLQEQLQQAHKELQDKEQLWVQADEQMRSDIFKLQTQISHMETMQKPIEEENRVLQAHQRAVDVERIRWEQIEIIQIENNELQTKISRAIQAQNEAEQQLAEAQQAREKDKTCLLHTEAQLQQAWQELQQKERLCAEIKDQGRSEVSELQNKICQMEETTKKLIEEENRALQMKENEAHQRAMDLERTLREEIEIIQTEKNELQTKISQAGKAQVEAEQKLAEAHQAQEIEKTDLLHTEEQLQKTWQDLQDMEKLCAECEAQRRSDVAELQKKISQIEETVCKSLEEENRDLLKREKEALHRAAQVEQTLKEEIESLQTHAMEAQAEAEKHLFQKQQAWEKERGQLLQKLQQALEELHDQENGNICHTEQITQNSLKASNDKQDICQTEQTIQNNSSTKRHDIIQNEDTIQISLEENGQQQETLLLEDEAGLLAELLQGEETKTVSSTVETQSNSSQNSQKTIKKKKNSFKIMNLFKNKKKQAGMEALSNEVGNPEELM